MPKIPISMHLPKGMLNISSKTVIFVQIFHVDVATKDVFYICQLKLAATIIILKIITLHRIHKNSSLIWYSLCFLITQMSVK